MSKKVFVYLPKEAMEEIDLDYNAYKEKLHQVAESLVGELLTDVGDINEMEYESLAGMCSLFAVTCGSVDAIIMMDPSSIIYDYGRRNTRTLWNMAADIADDRGIRLFTLDDKLLFTPDEIDAIWKKQRAYKTPVNMRAGLQPLQED